MSVLDSDATTLATIIEDHSFDEAQVEPVQHPWRLHHLETRMETWQTRARSIRPRSGIQMS